MTRIIRVGAYCLIGLTGLLMLTVIFLTVALAGEQLTLTAPITTPSTPSYTVERLRLDWPGASIHLQVLGPNGEAASCTWEGTTATTLMRALNKANLSTVSLQRRVLERAVTDGCLPAGTVGGTPE